MRHHSTPRFITPIRTALAAAVALAAMLAFSGVASAAAPQLPLKTQGAKIVDSGGQEVVLQGVNWFGFETSNHAPHGLWTRDYKEMLAQIKAQGFNTIRLPFSLQALRSQTTSGIDYGNGRNAALAGKTPQQVMDEIIAEADRQGLMIILDNHSTTDDSFMHPLWYGLGGFTEDDWVNTWKDLATRYASRKNVIGADLKNEPHGEATWG
ncbi:MAG: glycoside hydrolase family 5 protein, partial [Solirubrobacterales bacterium]